MTTDLNSVNENDLAELVLDIMEWRNIRHVPVEDNSGVLKGIITKKRLVRYLDDMEKAYFSTAADIMMKNPRTIGPEVDIKYAMLLMGIKKISCLPVVKNKELNGIITDKDTQQVWNKMNKRKND